MRVAMISMHTSPLATPGVGDAGGLNVYVAEVARRLGERGLKVDVFTRAEDTATPRGRRGQRAHPGDPAAGRARRTGRQGGCCPTWCTSSPTQLDAGIGDYDLVHSHYWLSGMVGLELKRAARAAAGAHHAHDGPGEERRARRGQTGEPDRRELGEAAVVAGADALTANTSDEAAELRSTTAPAPARSRSCRPGSTCTPSTPATSRSHAPSSGWPRTPR